jgi:hypothetical protein
MIFTLQRRSSKRRLGTLFFLVPVVYDITMHMTSDWGIHELSTYARVDPRGNLVLGGNLEMLRMAAEKQHASR